MLSTTTHNISGYENGISSHAFQISKRPYKRRIFRKDGLRTLRKTLKGVGATLICGAVFLSVPYLARAAEGPSVVIASEKSDQVISIESNAGRMLRLPKAASTVFVANPGVADVQLKSPRLIYLHGRIPGETTIYAVDQNDEIILNHRVNVSHNLSRLRELIATVRPNAEIKVASLNDSVVLTGMVASAVEADDLRGLASQVIGENGTVINRLQISTPQQVNLRVRIAEVSRTITKQLGFDLGIAQTIGSTVLNIATGSFATGVAAAGTQQLLGTFTRSRTNLNVLVDALDQNGLITVLAEPNLTAESGKAANFLVGGEFPIPVSDGDGEITVEFKEFGVGLNFVPIVMEDGRISIKILTEVSQLSAAGAVTINGLQIPALSTRRADTTVNLGSGQSFAIAGLLQNTTNGDLDRFPGLGEVPILGTLFRSTDFQKAESELVVIVTPYLVNPVSDRIAAPTDNFQAADEAERNLFGDQNRQLPASPRKTVFDGNGRHSQPSKAGFILR